MKTSLQIKKMVMLAMFIAILVVLDLTGLAFIRLPAISISTLDIIVIIGAITLGPKEGAILGGVFGIISMWEATYASSITDIVFSPFISGSPLSSLVMALGARILFGFIAGFMYRFLKNKKVNDYLSVLISVLTGLVIHNVTVIGCMVFLFPKLNTELKKIILSIVSVSFATKVVISFALSSVISRVSTKSLATVKE